MCTDVITLITHYADSHNQVACYSTAFDVLDASDRSVQQQVKLLNYCILCVQCVVLCAAGCSCCN